MNDAGDAKWSISISIKKSMKCAVFCFPRAALVSFERLRRPLGNIGNTTYFIGPRRTFTSLLFRSKTRILHDLPCNFRINMLAKFVCLRKKLSFLFIKYSQTTGNPIVWRHRAIKRDGSTCTGSLISRACSSACLLNDWRLWKEKFRVCDGVNRKKYIAWV